MVKEIIDRFLNALPAAFNMIELNARAKERSPYVVVCLQEVERMNILTDTMRLSLSDLDAGLAGSVNINDDMEKLS
jgi:dynein heavy chain